MAPGLALAFVVVAALLAWKGRPKEAPSALFGAGAVALLISAGLAAVPETLPLAALRGLLAAFGIAALAGGPAVALAATGSLMCLTPALAPEISTQSQLVLVAALAVGLLAARTGLAWPVGSVSYAAPVTLLVATVCRSLILSAERPDQLWMPVILTGCAVVAAAIVDLKIGKIVSWIAGPAVVAAGAWFVAHQQFTSQPLALAWLGAVGVAAVAAWFLAESSQSGTAIGFAAIVWVGMSTFGFAEARGIGIAGISLIALLVATALNSRALVLSTLALVAVVVMRFVRLEFPDSTNAFDIGQHYALIGLVAGVILVAAASEWPARASRFAGILLGAGLLAAIPASSIYLGQKGTVGLLVGLIIGPALASRAAGRALPASTLGVAGVCGLLAANGPITEAMQVDREAKVRLLLMIAGAAAVLIGAAYAMAKSPARNADQVSA